MEDNNIESVSRFYKLKSEYETHIQKKKSSILKSTTLSLNDKRKKIKQMRIPCINCKKDGGTIFKVENGTLSVFCGNEAPCNISLTKDKTGENNVVRRSKYTDIRDLIENTTDNVKYTKQQIIRSKLNYLFNYVDEATTVNDFNDLRENFKTLSERMVALRNNFFEMENQEKKKLVSDLEGNMQNLVNTLQQYVKEYKNTNNENSFKEMIEVYFSIVELAKQMREMKYEKNMIEDEYNENGKAIGRILAQEPITYQSYFVKISS